MGLKINVGKSKMLKVRKDQRKISESVRVDGNKMEWVYKFKYLGAMISVDDGNENDKRFEVPVKKQRSAVFIKFRIMKSL